jgi:hypothetical protein
MKIISDTLSALVETWDDPGDYPNAIAAGPLPSYDYLAGVEGELVVEADAKEMSDIVVWGWGEFLSQNSGIKLPDGILSVEWQLDEIVALQHGKLGCRLTFSCVEANADPDYRGPEPPDHEED